MKQFKVIEDNGGGLTLAVLNEDNVCEYIHTGYEYVVGQLQEDLAELKDGADPFTDWEGNMSFPDEYYQDLINDKTNVIIVDNYDIYTERMRRAARIEFIL